jgi:hypothetical protein
MDMPWALDNQISQITGIKELRTGGYGGLRCLDAGWDLKYPRRTAIRV